MKITENATNTPRFRIGINGNYYVYCKIKEPLEKVALSIGKSPVSIYFNEKYNVWTIRIKLNKHKIAVKEFFNKP